MPEKHQWWAAFIAIILACYSLGVFLFLAVDDKKPRFWFHKLSYYFWGAQIPLGKDNASFPLIILWLAWPFIPMYVFLIPVSWLFYLYFMIHG